MQGYLGDFVEDATVRFPLTTNDGSGGAVAPSDAFEAGDLKIYKNGSATQKTSTNGITVTSPFDSITGLHEVAIDTSNDTGDAGFWTTAADYWVVLDPDTETVDSQTVVAVVCIFSIENRSTIIKVLARILAFFQLLMRKDSAIATDRATELAEINANEGSGAGSYDNATDSEEAASDGVGLTGYVDGYVWVSFELGTDGTTVDVNGTIGNPVRKISDALTIATSRENYAIKMMPSSLEHNVGNAVSVSDPAQLVLDLNGNILVDGAGLIDVSGGIYEQIFSSTSPSMISCGPGVAWVTGDQGYYRNLLFNTQELRAQRSAYFAYCIFHVATTIFPVSGSGRGMFYGCSFLHPSVAFDFTSATATQDVNLHDCYGDITIRNMTGAGHSVYYTGWGKLTIANTCTAGTVKHTSHVEVVDENGDPYGGAVTVELISEPGGVSSFSGDAAFLNNANDIDGKTLQQALRITAAVAAGKISGAGTSTETFKGLDGTTDRAVVTADASGNRTNVSYP